MVIRVSGANSCALGSRRAVSRPTGWAASIRRAAGWLRFGGWCWLLWSTHAPWRQLGGIVGEPLRWAERTALPIAIWIGLVVGDFVRQAPAVRRRAALIIATLPSILAACVLQLCGFGMAATAVTGCWLGYVAGLDVSCDVRRLVDGLDPETDLAILSVAPDTAEWSIDSSSTHLRSSRPARLPPRGVPR